MIIDKKKKNLKLVKNCQECKNILPKYHVHHLLCKNCWEKQQFEKGNLALLGGVK